MSWKSWHNIKKPKHIQLLFSETVVYLFLNLNFKFLNLLNFGKKKYLERINLLV